jgi:hypothetical protein
MKNSRLHPGRSTAIAALAVLLGACVPSLHPFFTERDLISDETLPGRWQHGDNAWEFSAGEGQALRVTLSEGPPARRKMASFVGHLFQLGGHPFLDLVPDKLELAAGQSELVKAALIPGHLLIRVRTVGAKRQLLWCDPSWVDRYLASNPRALAHRRSGKTLALTAPTPELQAFVLAHLGDGQLFGRQSDWHHSTFERAAATAPADRP